MVLRRFLQSIFSAASGPSGKNDDATIRAAIERVVDGTDPRLRAVRRYQHKLRGAVECAIDHAVTLIDQLPPAIDASHRSFVASPQLRAAFASPDRLRETLSFSKHTRNYQQQSAGPLPAELYAVLGMERVEKTVLGVELHGDLVRRDVPQTTVSFCNQRLACLTDSEQATRRELIQRAFDSLIEVALDNLTTIRAHRRQLEQRHRELLQQKASALRSARLGLDSLLESTGPNLADAGNLERQLWDLEAELGKVRAGSATLDHLLARIIVTLSKPDKHLRLEPVALTLDHMNIKVSPGSSRPGNALSFNEALLGKDRRLTVLLVRFPSSELLAPPDFFQEAQRLLTPRLLT
ncbi:MAG: hypothetical protein EKK68_01645 [Candidatus Competibacteraceae bacterium]|nr:MAG: hypothetical protein EKK68_01645 [Candidatus Competibacteraceae bacterium]